MVVLFVGVGPYEGAAGYEHRLRRGDYPFTQVQRDPDRRVKAVQEGLSYSQ